LIRHAKSDWKNGSLRDFERGLSKRGYKDLKSMGSYMSIQGMTPDLIISSLSLRAQTTADELAERLEYRGKIHYMKELYRSSPENYFNILTLQDNEYDTIFLIGHNPEITEFANIVIDKNFAKFPALGVLAIDLNIDSWDQIVKGCGEINFFIQPKQFKYFVPKQIRTNIATLKHK